MVLGEREKQKIAVDDSEEDSITGKNKRCKHLTHQFSYKSVSPYGEDKTPSTRYKC